MASVTYGKCIMANVIMAKICMAKICMAKILWQMKLRANYLQHCLKYNLIKMKISEMENILINVIFVFPLVLNTFF